jgi:hypothetical protein
MQRIGVGEVISGPAGFHGTGLIVSRGLRLGCVVRNFDDPVRRPRQLPEQAGQFRVGTLGDIAVFAHQILRVRVVETRVGAQEVQEFLETALEAHGLDDHIHFGADAFHFAQANFVDLLRCHLRGGAHGHIVPVPGLAVGAIPGGNGFTRTGQVLVFCELKQFFVGGHDLLAVDVLCTLTQGFGLQGINGGRDFHEAFQQRTLARIIDQLALNLLRHVPQGDTRWCDARFKAFSHQSDGLVDISGKSLHACNLVLQLVDLAIGHHGQQPGQGLLRPAHLVHWQVLVRELMRANLSFQAVQQQVIVQLLLLRQAAAFDVPDQRQRGQFSLLAARHSFSRQIHQTILATRVAPPGGRTWTFEHGPVVTQLVIAPETLLIAEGIRIRDQGVDFHLDCIDVFEPAG